MAHNRTIISNWTHYLKDVKFSTQRFYNIMEQAIYDLELPGVSVSRINLVEESGFLNNTKREHLEIFIEPQCTGFVVYAAPFSKFFFFSVKCIRDSEIYESVTSYRPNESFYAADTTSLKETIVGDCIKDVINELFNEKGPGLFSHSSSSFCGLESPSSFRRALGRCRLCHIHLSF